jgi:hypothetical protein
VQGRGLSGAGAGGVVSPSIVGVRQTTRPSTRHDDGPSAVGRPQPGWSQTRVARVSSRVGTSSKGPAACATPPRAPATSTTAARCSTWNADPEVARRQHSFSRRAVHGQDLPKDKPRRHEGPHAIGDSPSQRCPVDRLARRWVEAQARPVARKAGPRVIARPGSLFARPAIPGASARIVTGVSPTSPKRSGFRGGRTPADSGAMFHVERPGSADPGRGMALRAMLIPRAPRGFDGRFALRCSSSAGWRSNREPWLAGQPFAVLNPRAAGRSRDLAGALTYRLGGAGRPAHGGAVPTVAWA